MFWTAIAAVLFVILTSRNRGPSTMLGDEYQLIEEIRAAKSDIQREQLTAKLADTPVRIYPFHSRWMLINDVQPFDCWTDSGYDSSLSDLPRDIQILAATTYGKSDIDNGGFHQFFSNGTGTFAPEMIEWFERSELHEAAKILKDAIAVFGEEFPRSQRARNDFLSKFPGNSREEWDPFYAMDHKFYDSLPYGQNVFDLAADRWLRDACGVNKLNQRLDSRTKR